MIMSILLYSLYYLTIMSILLIYYFLDDLNPESFLDYRMRGQNLDDHGQVQWLISDCINGI